MDCENAEEIQRKRGRGQMAGEVDVDGENACASKKPSLDKLGLLMKISFKNDDYDFLKSDWMEVQTFLNSISVSWDFVAIKA